MGTVFMVFCLVNYIKGKVTSPDPYTLEEAKAASSIILREPVQCWGDSNKYNDSGGFQCQGQDTKVKWVSCLGRDCYQIK